MTKATKKAVTYPAVGTFATDKELKAHYKKLSDEEVFNWVKQEGLSFKPDADHPAITRMRACMAILNHHFPKEAKAKKESPYKSFSTEQLVQMATDKSVVYESTSDQRILRMRLIMNRRAAGHIG